MSQRRLRSAATAAVEEASTAIKKRSLSSAKTAVKKSKKQQKVAESAEVKVEVEEMDLITATVSVKKIVTKKIVARNNTDHIPQLKYFNDKKSPNVTGKVLPVEFYKVHTERFTTGLEYILSKDPSLSRYIVEPGPFHGFLRKEEEDPKLTQLKKSGVFYFEKLISSVISQQISGKAAESIKLKLITKLSDDGKTPDKDGRYPLPVKFVNTSIEELRSCGLSYQKAKYVKSLANAFLKDEERDSLDGELLEELQMVSMGTEDIRLNYDFFNNYGHEETEIDDLKIDNNLQRFKGIGPWSSSMFLMFALNKMDIFENKDLGIRRGVFEYLKDKPLLVKEINSVIGDPRYNIKRSTKQDKYANDEVLDVLSCQFKPFRTVIMLIFWRMSDISIDVLEG